MNMIFFGEAANDSGNLGFSDACPLIIYQHSACKIRLKILTIQPIQHAHPFAQRRLRSILHWRSYYCWFLPEPSRCLVLDVEDVLT